MSGFDGWIERHARRIRWGRFLERAAECLAGFLFVFGGTVLVVKLLLPSFWPDVLWMGIATLPALGVAWWLSQRNRSSRNDSVAMLDRKLKAGGLLMTLSEAPDENWAEHLPQMERMWREGVPRFRPVRFARYLALPLIFAVGSCLVPLRDASTAPTLTNSVGKQESQELEEMFETLEESPVFDEEEKKELQEEIEKLSQEAEKTPLTHEKWETVDSLRERMRMRLSSTSMNMAKAQEAASVLAKSAAGEGPELSAERTEQLEQNLSETLQKLARNGAFSKGSKSGDSELRKLMKKGKNGQLRLPQDPAQRKKLLKKLKKHLEKESQKLAKLRKQCQGQCPLCKKGNCNKPGGT